MDLYRQRGYLLKGLCDLVLSFGQQGKCLGNIGPATGQVSKSRKLPLNLLVEHGMSFGFRVSGFKFGVQGSGGEHSHCGCKGLDCQSMPSQGDAARVSDRVLPLSFSARIDSDGVAPYLLQSPFKELLAFFQGKGLSAIKEEDRRQQWYEDWLKYQAEHRLYATVLSPSQYSTIGAKLDLLQLTRFLEAFAYFSPGHGYSLQCTFLGLFSILMGTNEAMKRNAVAAIESGRLLAFGVS